MSAPDVKVEAVEPEEALGREVPLGLVQFAPSRALDDSEYLLGIALGGAVVQPLFAEGSTETTALLLVGPPPGEPALDPSRLFGRPVAALTRKEAEGVADALERLQAAPGTLTLKSDSRPLAEEAFALFLGLGRRPSLVTRLVVDPGDRLYAVLVDRAEPGPATATVEAVDAT